MTFFEFEFWEKCMAAGMANGLAPADAARGADIAVGLRRERAIKVTDYHGDGLYSTPGPVYK